MGIVTAMPEASGDTTSEPTAYLQQVMAEIDAEVARRRASGDLPAGLERELDELFLEFAPVGAQGRSRLREALSLVDGAAFVDIAVPVASDKRAGGYIKRAVRGLTRFYFDFVVHQIVRFAWAVSRLAHQLVDRLESVESEIDALRPVPVPAEAVPVADDGDAWWAPVAVKALAPVTGRVLHAECGTGSLVAALQAAGVDAYGVEPSQPAAEAASAAGLDVRNEAAHEHLGVVPDEGLAGIIMPASLQWCASTERAQLVALAASRLAVGGVLVLHSATPAGWLRRAPTLLADLAPGRPLHVDTWVHLLAGHGLAVTETVSGGSTGAMERVDADLPGAASINAALELVEQSLLGPDDYVLVATRER